MKRKTLITIPFLILGLAICIYVLNDVIPKSVITKAINKNCDIVEQIMLNAENLTYHQLAKKTANAVGEIEKLKSSAKIVANSKAKKDMIQYLEQSQRVLQKHKELWEAFVDDDFYASWIKLQELDNYWGKAKQKERAVFKSIDVNYAKSSKSIFYRYKETPVHQETRDGITQCYLRIFKV